MPDVIDELLGIAPGSRLDELRALRPDVRLATQASEIAIFESESGLTRTERHAVALHVAELNKDEALAAHHRGKAGDTPRIPILLAHATMLTKVPDQATPEAIQALIAAGLAPRDVVMLSQLVAHVNYEARLLAGLRLVGEA